MDDNTMFSKPKILQVFMFKWYEFSNVLNADQHEGSTLLSFFSLSRKEFAKNEEMSVPKCKIITFSAHERKHDERRNIS